MERSVAENDLRQITASTADLWAQLSRARIFLTGGTGFIGRWLLEAFRHADRELALNLRVTVLTRDPLAFRTRAPHLADHDGFDFIGGDIREFESVPGTFSHMIHAATDANAHLNEHMPGLMFDTIVTGTRRALEFAVEKRIPRVLFLSSGAVYGQQPWEITHIREDWSGGPDCTNPRNAYGEGKRAAEMLCAIYGKRFGLEVAIARIFALLGPLLTLDAHFAAGNFIRDALEGKPVVVNGNGRACRSYLYTTDLVIWLLHLLARGEAGHPYNVGSDESVSIRELAERVAVILGTGEVEVRGAPDPGWNPGRYVPDTSLAATRLGLGRAVTLDEAIRRTARWHGWMEQR